jgi:hypothetical protein
MRYLVLLTEAANHHRDGICEALRTVAEDGSRVKRCRCNLPMRTILMIAIFPEFLFALFISAERYHAPITPAVVCLTGYTLGSGE